MSKQYFTKLRETTIRTFCEKSARLGGNQPISSKNILPSMARDDFMEAVQCLVKDPDKKFDEVLVDRFVDLIELELSRHHKDWMDTARHLVETVEALLNDKEFVMFDQARAFKFLRAIIDSKILNRQEFEDLQPILDSFWSVVPNVIVNSNLSAATVMLQILKSLWRTRYAYDWLIERTIEPPICIGKERVKDIASLAGFYLKYSNNYHTLNKAEELFQELFSASYTMNLAPEHPLVVALLETAEELLLAGSDTIVSVIIKLCSKVDAKCFRAKFGICDMVQECFEAMIKNPKCNFIILSKCVAMSGRRKFVAQNVELLKNSNRIEALIVYLVSRPHYWNHSDLNEFVQTYLIYPLLATCKDLESKEIISRLKLNNVDTQRIDKCNHSRLSLHCLIYLNQILQDKKLIESQLQPSTIPTIMKMIANFIKTHIDSRKHYKSMLECSKTLSLLLDLHYSKDVSRFEPDVLLGVLDIIEGVQEGFTERRKPILINYLGLVRNMDEKVQQVKCEPSLEPILLVKSMYERITSMASKFDDIEVLEEFLYFFINPSRCTDLQCISWITEPFFRLLWSHMLPKFRLSEGYGSPLGKLLETLLFIDRVQCDYEQIQIMLKNFDILRIVGDVLIERATDYNVIEPVISYLRSSEYLYIRMPCQDTPPTDESMEDYKPNSPLPTFNEVSFHRLILGFCTSIWKSEIPQRACMDAVAVMFRMVKMIMRTSSSTRQTLNCLVKTGLFATLHGIVSSSSYSEPIYQRARMLASYIHQNVVLENFEDHILDELTIYNTERLEIDKLRKRARILANFYNNAIEPQLCDISMNKLSQKDEEKEEDTGSEDDDEDAVTNNINLMVHNFLNYNDYDNIMDCH